MNIIVNKNENLIEIKDHSKRSWWLFNTTAFFTITTTIGIPFFVLDRTQMASFGFIWIVLGIFLIILQSYQIFKKSFKEKLNFSEISYLNEIQFFRRKNLSIKLKNGKSRDLLTIKTTADILETKRLFESIGIDQK